MADRLHEFAGVRVLAVDAAGAPIADRQAIIDLIGAAASHQADLVAIPVERQGADFFDLKTRLAGEMLQVCVNCNLPVAFVGDLAAERARSGALTDFIRESNKGRQVWFVDDLASLERKLAAA
jgi:hypothetical protein